MHTVVEKNIAGKTLRLETGKIAKQAHGAVIVRSGDTVVLCAATEGGVRPDIDHFPLMCDYRERMYAAGKIPGSFFRRENRPSTRETLVSRLIDRPVRPNFPHGYKNEVIVDCHVLSFDPDHNSDVLAMIGASAALGVSQIPFQAILGAARVGCIDGQLVVNPSEEQMAKSTLDLVVSGTKESIMMVESCAKELPEDMMIRALEMAHQAIGQVVELQEELVRKAGKEKTAFVPAEPVLKLDFSGEIAGLKAAFSIPEKKKRNTAVEEFKEKLKEKTLAGVAAETLAKAKSEFADAFSELKHTAMRELIYTGRRCDGRNLTQVRPISIETQVLPRTHGSALFTRGETQALVTCTLGTSRDAMIVDDYGPRREDPFMLHYNFPGFSVGEAKTNRGPGRREIGHGNLALRALTAVMPSQEAFPYTVRVVSEITESNGSSSMASVCGGSLALMDAGVPLAAPVAGIAMGLIKDGDREAVLTDILGDEDHYGDMDFKVAGTAKGVTALQMDIKIGGIGRGTMEKALQQAREGRMHILAEMTKVIAAPKSDVSDFAPKVTAVKIPVDLIGKLIGPGGKMIRSIQEDTGAEVTVEDDGTVRVFAVNGEAAKKALERVKALTETAEIGKTYEGEVKGVRDFGAFVEIMPEMQGLLHISELSDEYASDINKLVALGDKLRVVVTEVDEKTGKIRLMKEERYLRLKEAGELPAPRARRDGPRRDGPRRDGDRGRDRDRGPRRNEE